MPKKATTLEFIEDEIDRKKYANDRITNAIKKMMEVYFKTGVHFHVMFYVRTEMNPDGILVSVKTYEKFDENWTKNGFLEYNLYDRKTYDLFFKKTIKLQEDEKKNDKNEINENGKKKRKRKTKKDMLEESEEENKRKFVFYKNGLKRKKIEISKEELIIGTEQDLSGYKISDYKKQEELYVIPEEEETIENFDRKKFEDNIKFNEITDSYLRIPDGIVSNCNWKNRFSN